MNVDSLKEVVERTDVKGAAKRVNAAVVGPINGLFRFLLKLLGIFFVLFGLSVLFGLIASETYILSNGNTWGQYNIFPVGFREHLLLYTATMVVALMGVFIIFFGIAMFRRKWPIRTWVTGTLLGIAFIGMAVGGALAGNVYPNVRDRYNANVHNSIRTLPSFSTLSVSGDTNINFQTSKTYYVELQYYGHPNLRQVKTTVRNNELIIDSSQFNESRNCRIICIPNGYNLMITVYSPNAQQLFNQFSDIPNSPPNPPVITTLYN